MASRLHRLGGHVRSHAVAYVALFFSLSGTAVAAGGVLKNSDPAGGDLAGTYPNPTLRAGAVGTSDFAGLPTASVNRSGPPPGEPGSGTQSIPNNDATRLTFNAQEFDTDGIANLGADNARLTVNTPGVYLVTAIVSWAHDPDGMRRAVIRTNESDDFGFSQVQPVTEAPVPDSFGTSETMQSVTAVAPIDAGQTIELVVRHTAGAALSTSDRPLGVSARLAVHWLGPLAPQPGS